MFFPFKQEVDFTSVCQSGKDSLFYCFDLRETDWGEQLITDSEFQLEKMLLILLIWAIW